MLKAKLNHTGSPIIIANLIIALGAAGTAAFILPVSPYRACALLAGSFMYLLSMALTIIDPYVHSDYVQKGEAALPSFIIYMVLLQGTHSIILLMLLSFLGILLLEVFNHAVLMPGAKDDFIFGILMQSIFAALAGYLIWTGAYKKELLMQILTGYCGFITIDPLIYVSMIPAFALIVFLFFRLRHLGSLYSLGGVYFELSSISIFRFRMIMILVRSVVITGVIFFLGWFGAMGFYAYSLRRSRSKYAIIEAGLLSILCSIIAVIALSFFDNLRVVLFFVALSYGMFGVYVKKKLNKSAVPL